MNTTTVLDRPFPSTEENFEAECEAIHRDLSEQEKRYKDAVYTLALYYLAIEARRGVTPDEFQSDVRKLIEPLDWALGAGAVNHLRLLADMKLRRLRVLHERQQQRAVRLAA
jgi:hypothetical protein